MSNLLADVQRDAPQLVWLMQLALDNGIPMNPKLEAVAALKQAILKKTGSEAQWRLLCHSQQQDFDTLLNHPTAQYPWLILRQWLRFLDDIGACRQLPEPIIRLLLNALIVQIGLLIDPSHLTRLYQVAVLKIIARECLDRDGLRPDQMERFAADDVALVLEWAGPEKVKLDKNQEKSGWQHLLRRARSWQKRTLHKCLLGKESVPTLIDQMETENYLIKPLNTPYLLWDEGFEMHHCVGKLWNLATNGKSRFFSIRQVEGDKRLATVELQKEGRGKWKVFDCRRYFNAEATPELLNVSQTLADSYSQAERLAA